MRIVIYLLFILFSLSGSSQEVPKEKKKLDVVFSPGIILQHQFFNDINLIIGHVVVEKSKIPVVGIQGFRVGLEHNFKGDDDFIIAPKIGYEISVTVFSLRLSAANYYRNKASEFRLIPEIGISTFGLFNLTYGYGIAFNNSDITKLSHHRVSLTINLDKRLVNAVFSTNQKNL